jgi:predicted O-methyltransferase YrrM
MKNTSDMTHVNFVNPTEAENEILTRLDNSYTKISEMSLAQRMFINALILRNRPKKLLEIGVSAGGSSIVILNAIKDISDAKLFSIDLYDAWCKDTDYKTGYFVDNYPQLKGKWELFTDGLALKFIEKITGGEKAIDLCLIDTVHCNPGEILDILMVLPFLKDDAMVIFHDVALHTYYFLEGKTVLGQKAITNNLLMSSITGEKYLMNGMEGEKFPNIAGIKINKYTKENIFEIFNLLMLKWSYIPTELQEKEILSHFGRYYDEYYINYLKEVFEYQKKIMVHDKNYKLKETIKRIIGKDNIKKIKKIMGKK